MRQAPPPRDSWQSAVEEAEELRFADAAEHYRVFEEACRLAFAILAARTDRDAVLDNQDPLPPETIRLLERLVAEHARDAADAPRPTSRRTRGRS